MSILEESLVSGEFKFGFELEAYIGKDIMKEYRQEFKNYLNDKYFEEMDEDTRQDALNEVLLDRAREDLMQYFVKNFGTGIMLTTDLSLDILKGGFEFPSPVMTFSPLNIKKCIEFLYKMRKDELHIYTDNTCGFHTHLSFPSMTIKDEIWIICHIALDDNLQKLLSYFNASNGKTIRFFSQRFASREFLKDIKKAILNEQWADLNKLLSTEKYRLLRIHPQKTIEWRGPRNFLNKNELNNIKNYFIQLYTVVTSIIKIMDKTDINGMPRNSFFQLITPFDLTSKEYKKYEYENIVINKIIKKPLLLTKFNNSVTHKLNWRYIIRYLNDKTNGRFTTTLRYQTFQNKHILDEILKVQPGFQKYVQN